MIIIAHIYFARKIREKKENRKYDLQEKYSKHGEIHK